MTYLSVSKVGGIVLPAVVELLPVLPPPVLTPPVPPTPLLLDAPPSVGLPEVTVLAVALVTVDPALEELDVASPVLAELALVIADTESAVSVEAAVVAPVS